MHHQPKLFIAFESPKDLILQLAYREARGLVESLLEHLDRFFFVFNLSISDLDDLADITHGDMKAQCREESNERCDPGTLWHTAGQGSRQSYRRTEQIYRRRQ
jgi:hypothetical protein